VLNLGGPAAEGTLPQRAVEPLFLLRRAAVAEKRAERIVSPKETETLYLVSFSG